MTLAASVVLAACTTAEDAQRARDEAARSVIANVLAPEYAGVTMTPVLDCIVETTSPEARAALVEQATQDGITGGVTARVRQMEQSSAARSCIAAKGVVKPRSGGI